MTSKSRTVYADNLLGSTLIPVQIDASEKIGSGAFALVFRSKVGSKTQAVKIWKKIEPEMSQKLAYLVQHMGQWVFPTNVYYPIYLVRDNSSRQSPVVGMTMDLIQPDSEEVGKLFNRKTWPSLGIDHKKVATLFANGFSDLEKIGQQQFIVVDISGRNVLFNPKTLQMVWIDFDSWKIQGLDFGEPFMYTPDFIDPLLVDPRYKVHANKPQPKPENDMATMGRLFAKSFFGVDIYGGTHAKIFNQQDRIEDRIWFMDPQVTLPSKAAHPYQATDEILHALELTYVQDKRGILKAGLFIDMATKMRQCQQGHWHTRSACPICTNVIPVPIKPSLLESVTLKVLLNSTGTIVQAKFINNTLIAIAYEHDKVVTYKKGRDGEAERIEIFDYRPGLRFEIVGDNFIAVNQGSSKDIEVWDIRGSTAKLFETTTSEPYASNRDRVPFRGSGDNLIRLARQSLLERSLEYGAVFVDRKLPIQTSRNQTWFWSSQTQDIHFVLLNLLLDPETLAEQHHYMLLVNGNRLDVPVSNLNDHETLLDASVRFGEYSLLYRRITREGMSKYLRTEVIGYDGQIWLSYQTETTNHPNPIVRGVGYTDTDEFGQKSEPVVWHPTDEGLAKEYLEQKKLSRLKPTQGAVTADDSVVHIRSRGNKRHFLVIRENQIDYLVLNSV